MVENKAEISNRLDKEQKLLPNHNSADITSLIQIKATSEQEVNRRIHAFIKNKRSEVDDTNIREFICPLSSEPGTSCARVEAVYIHREGQKSHISLKKVENSSGPQTLLPVDDFDGRSNLSCRVPVDIQRAEAVEERLCNIETHLNVKNNTEDLYARIKALEERINFLEGLSPEYFTNSVPQKKRKLQNTVGDVGNPGELKQNSNLSDIDIKIRQLRQVLKEKALDLKKRNLD